MKRFVNNIGKTGGPSSATQQPSVSGNGMLKNSGTKNTYILIFDIALINQKTTIISHLTTLG